MVVGAPSTPHFAFTLCNQKGHAMAQLVEALRYKPEGIFH
jgi:hypothetical protein